MQVKTTTIEGLLIIEPQVFNDPRGYFYESYSKEKLSKAGVNLEFVQDNQSLSQKGIIRGMHFQAPPFEQGKLVRVIQGAVNDVVIDIRKNSSTYGQYYSIILTAENKKMFYIPPGFAHGFETLEDNTIFLYKCTNIYNKESEGGVLWNDNEININWENKNPIISEKDAILPTLKNLQSPF